MANETKRVALVTGVSSGIGKAIALTLAKNGFVVFGTSRKAETGRKVDGMTMIRLDVTDDASVTTAVREVIDRAGRLDVLVNNAGLGVVGGSEESSVSQAKALFDTNVFGVIRMMNAVLPHMRSNRSGRIVNISSILGIIPAPFVALYAATKHAIEGYSESVDHEVRTLGIKIIAIEPGYTNTPFDQNLMAVDAPLEDYRHARERSLAMMSEVLKTADEPEVVADTVLKALTATAPKARYPAGKMAGRLSVVRRFLPTRGFDKALRKSMQLDQ